MTNTGEKPPEPDVSDPAKLIRLGIMVQTLLADVGAATQDEGGRRRLAAIHKETVEELSKILSEDLREELADFNECIACENPSPGEVRVAQAQLFGWMQGLLRGMQASATAQAAMAQRQLALQTAGRMPGPAGAPMPPGAPGGPVAGADEASDLPGYL